MKWVGILAISLTANTFTTPANAGYFDDGNKLYADCTTSESSSTYYLEQSRCVGYITGVLDTWSMYREFGAKKGDCTPSGMNKRQAIDIVIQHLKNNPKDRNIVASILVMNAFIEAYPECKD